MSEAYRKIYDVIQDEIKELEILKIQIEMFKEKEAQVQQVLAAKTALVTQLTQVIPEHDLADLNARNRRIGRAPNALQPRIIAFLRTNGKSSVNQIYEGASLAKHGMDATMKLYPVLRTMVEDRLVTKIDGKYVAGSTAGGALVDDENDKPDEGIEPSEGETSVLDSAASPKLRTRAKKSASGAGS